MRVLVPVCALLFVWLGGCSEDKAPPELKDTVFDTQIEALDKARQVEDMLQERAKRTREDSENGR